MTSAIAIEYFLDLRKYLLSCPETDMIVDSQSPFIWNAKIRTKYNVIVCTCRKP